MVKLAPSVKELTIASIITEPGNAVEFKTGTWKTGLKPSMDQSKCKKCLLCWIYCPDIAIVVKEDGSVETDHYYCKGCGLCSKVCPYKAIEMVKEVVEFG